MTFGMAEKILEKTSRFKIATENPFTTELVLALAVVPRIMQKKLEICLPLATALINQASTIIISSKEK